jgi:hypothetical protein
MAAGLAGPSQQNTLTPQSGINYLNQALQANSQAYGGAQNAAQQQYQNNAGSVLANLTNAGLGNTTIAQTMQQAPLQTYNNALLNILGAQQGSASNIYGQMANTANSNYQLQSQLGNQQSLANTQLGAQQAMQGSALGAQSLNNAVNSLGAGSVPGYSSGQAAGPGGMISPGLSALMTSQAGTPAVAGTGQIGYSNLLNALSPQTAATPTNNEDSDTYGSGLWNAIADGSYNPGY